MKNNGTVIWFTGAPCSGKTTIADSLKPILEETYKKKVIRLDGDIVRKSLTSDLGFSKEDRIKNIERVAFVADLVAEAGGLVLCTFVSPTEEIRKVYRNIINQPLIEVFVKSSIEECIRRDVKGMYKKALNGEIKEFTGVSAPFEKPVSPHIILDTEKETVLQSGENLLSYLKSIKVIRFYEQRDRRIFKNYSNNVDEIPIDIVRKCLHMIRENFKNKDSI